VEDVRVVRRPEASHIVPAIAYSPLLLSFLCVSAPLRAISFRLLEGSMPRRRPGKSHPGYRDLRSLLRQAQPDLRMRRWWSFRRKSASCAGCHCWLVQQCTPEIG